VASQNPVTFTQLQQACDSLCNTSLYLQFMPKVFQAKDPVSPAKSGLVRNTLRWASVELLMVHI